MSIKNPTSQDELDILKSMKNSLGSGDYTLQEIADILGVTRERVRQIESSAIKKLRHPRNRKKWEAIMDTVGELSNQRARNTNVV